MSLHRVHLGSPIQIILQIIPASQIKISRHSIINNISQARTSSRPQIYKESYNARRSKRSLAIPPLYPTINLHLPLQLNYNNSKILIQSHSKTVSLLKPLTTPSNYIQIETISHLKLLISLPSPITIKVRITSQINNRLKLQRGL